jgi:hypothetical protein
MSVLINASTSTGLVQSADTSGEIELQSNGTTALKVNTNEGIQILNCLGVGNATPSTSGAGITFPATQSASTDANTLDDYEEGTWTPVASSAGGSLTAYTSSGNYTKIGRVVTLYGSITTTTVGTASGTLDFTGVPFNTLDGKQFIGVSRETASTGANNFIGVFSTSGQIQTITGGGITWVNGYSYQFNVTYQAD